MSQSPCFRCASGDPFRIAALLLMAMLACAADAMAGQSDQPMPPGTYAKDAVQTCLRQCHDKAPINLILQTPHAVKADQRTPFAQHQCETCHGASPDHIDVTSNPVAVRYKGPNASPVAQRNAVCLSCHKSGRRMSWRGSQHLANDVACDSCHTVHAAKDPVLVEASQSQKCFTCHPRSVPRATRCRTIRSARAAWPAQAATPPTAGRQAC